MNDKVTQQLNELETMPMPELKALWRQHFTKDPVRFNREMMVRRIAYRIQEKAYGGLSKSVRNKLQRLIDGQETIRPELRLSPGIRLMRTYKGERIYVNVLEEGFEFRGQKYQSLTAIASELMGSRTSGPRFFGLLEGSDEQ